MKPVYAPATLAKIICASCLLFSTLIYSSCKQKTPAGQPTQVTDSVTVKPIVTADAPAVASLSGPVNSAEETVMRYDQMMKEYLELAKMVKDSANLTSHDVVTISKKIEWLKNEGRPAMHYFSGHRKEFSKAQIKKIYQDIDEIDKASTMIMKP